MTDHPAIVALAKEIYAADPFDLGVVALPWGQLNTDVQASYLTQARAAYAAVIRDLIAQSQPEEFWFREIITARAREIGVGAE